METSIETAASRHVLINISSDESLEDNPNKEAMSLEICSDHRPFAQPLSPQPSEGKLSANEMARIHEVIDQLKEEINNKDVIKDLREDKDVIVDLVSGKIDMKVAAMVITNAYYMRMYRRTATKQPDPGKFTIPVNIEGVNFKSGMCDLGSSVNLMTEDTFDALKIGYLKRRRMTIILADGSHKRCLGVTEGVTVKAGKFMIPTDFWILSFDREPPDPFILGRPFLKTSGALIDVLADVVQLRVGGEAVTFDMKKQRAENEEDEDFMITAIEETSDRLRRSDIGKASTKRRDPP